MAVQGRRVLLCVGGGIAAYKSCEVARLLVKAGAQVRVALTPAAQRFVTALTFQALTGAAVAADIFSAEQELAAGHVALADWAELAVVAPATANLIARMRIGQGDDAAAAALLAIEPRRWLLAPAMNEKMWASPAVQENVRVLGERGARFVGPAVGEMAERSHVGPGRMSEPAEIFAACSDALAPRDFEAVPVLVTAGPTREMLDPVRFLSNPSSGRMGWAIAEAARDRGARVTLISGPVELARPANVQVVDVVSADDLARAVDSHLDGVRVVVMAAAVADQRPAARAPHKAKKKPGEETLKLVRTPDILEGLGARPQHPLLVGFAAETENVEQNARDKLARKNLDLIVANDVADAFGKDSNRVLVLGKDGARREIEGSKLTVAHAIWDMVRERLPG
ncbi:MAG TPA: bifunctional phosphopantothenoylcysteine decarboxylase/phosphopantothenate--cysteine ligase CoaBC [Myxococcales bacterium]|jgi:phosphopantothenoylcysteine decarboxylase / phosphopantothenate---cysteine ligase|nr:bifunctional phosphopantothenoylcysteine decarboxylase/phosphopantothenate--cysteine ligase CoaBC [Myxococcales bacterium]